MALAIGLAAVLLVADAAWAVWSANGALRSARDDLRCGSDALLDGAIDEADDCFERAQRHAATATTFRLHPSMFLAGSLPWIGDDVDAVAAMAEAADGAATGGASLTVAARAAGWSDGGVALMGPDGQVDLDAVDRALPGLNAAADDLQQASDALGAVDPASLVEPLSAAVTEARDRLQPQTDLVVDARDLGQVLPGMIGADGPKRYLLAFQNLSAPRGTGGYLGFVGEVEADDGKLSLDSLDPVGDVEPVPPVEVPPDVARRYGRFGAATTMWASNYPPDVAESSRIATQIWEASGRRPVDGVVWADTVWMADMLAASGPVESSAWPDPITSENLVEVFNRRLFELDSAFIDPTQAQLGLDLWGALLTRQPDPAAFGRAMAEGTRGGHFAVFSFDERTQAALERLDAAGRFTLGENPLAVVWQDASANRAGYFAEHEVASSVNIEPDGTATVRTSVTMRNRAPDGPPSELLGDGKGTPVGWWGADIEIYLPADAEDPRIRTSSPSVIDVDEAYGHPVADAFLYADSGARMSATVSYRDPGAAAETEGTWTYAVQVLPQPMLRPVPYSLELVLPGGAEVIALPEGASATAEAIRWSGSPTSPLELEFVYRLAA